jgi:hypothetical protein
MLVLPVVLNMGVKARNFFGLCTTDNQHSIVPVFGGCTNMEQMTALSK